MAVCLKLILSTGARTAIRSLLLVRGGSSINLNPTLDPDIIAEDRERDPAAAIAEWDGCYREDILDFIAKDIVLDCVAKDTFERPPNPNIRYWAGTDPSGGAADSFCLSIVHVNSNNHIIHDVLREIPAPFNPEDATDELVNVLRSYRVTTVVGDAYSANWVSDAFERRRITYQRAEKPKTQLYLEMLPWFTSRRIEILSSQRLINQLCGLQRMTSRGGRDQVSHPINCHDDAINSLAVAVAAANVKSEGYCTANFGIWENGRLRLVEQDSPEGLAILHGDWGRGNARKLTGVGSNRK